MNFKMCEEFLHVDLIFFKSQLKPLKMSQETLKTTFGSQNGKRIDRKINR